MKPPSKKRAGREIPDLTKEELVETVGGTDGEASGEGEEWEKSVEGDEGGGGYGRPLEQDVDDRPL